MIRYILGKSNSGKSKFIHQMIGQKLSEKQLLIVPEQYTLQAEVELIHDLNCDGIMNIEVMSFNRFCIQVINETGALSETEINSLGKAMVLRSILDQHHEELLVFGDISKKNGFVEKLSTLMSEMKRVGIEAEDLNKKLLSSDMNLLVDRKLKDVALILEYYQTFMAKGYFDEEDKLLAVINRLETSQLLKHTSIYFDGFDSFSNQEYMLMEEMMRLAKECTFALTLEQDNPIFEPVIKTFKKIRKVVDRLGLEEMKKELVGRSKYEDLEALRREFFSYPYTPYDQPLEHIHLHMNNNVYDEVENIAKDICRQIRKGSRYKDLAVVTGNIEGYTSIIKRIFSEYNIPYFIDDKVSIMNHPIIKFILSSLYCLNSGFKKEDVLKVIKTGLTDVDEKTIPLFENYVLKRGLRGNRWLEPFEDEVLEMERFKLIQPLMHLKDNFSSKKTIGEMTKMLFDYLILSKIPEKIEVWIEYLQSENALDKVQESTQIWNMIIEILDQLVELEGDDVKTIKEYLRILEAGFTEVSLGLIPPSIDQVVIGSIERSKSKTTKGLYVLGLNDGVIPKKYSDEGILLDDEKQILKEEGLDLETDAASIMARDYFSTYVAFSKATEFIHLNFSLADYEGKALRPSIYIDKLQRVFPKIETNSHVIEDQSPSDAYNPYSHYNLLTEKLRRYADDYIIDDAWLSVLAWYNAQDEWHEKTTRLKGALFYDNQVHHISKKHSKALYDLPLTSSVSRLERYERCPFSHFVHYGLKPKRRDEYEIRLPDIGSLFHKTLEFFDAKMKTNHVDWQSISREQTFVMIDEIVDELVSDYNSKIFESSHRYQYLIKKLKRVGKRAAWTLVTQVKQGEFIPYAHEISFSTKGFEQSVPPIIIELSSGDRMMLEGQIDRVDLFDLDGKKYIKVIDYKSGSKKFSLSEVYQGLQLQLMVYLDAILENSDFFRADELYPAGVFYFKIDDPILESEILKGEMTESEILKALKMDGLLLEDLSVATAMDQNIQENRKSNVIPFELKKDDSISSRSKVAKEDEFLGLIEYVKETIKEIGDQISDGVTKIAPVKLGTMTGCQSCDYQSICQFDQSFGNRYKYLKNYKDDEVLEAIKERENHAKVDK
ncbi:MAG: helicase-exonuclease AddAB subunit AddB [Clostridiales bacterium]|nr:helicase-exonuclease AddAB subunit AddB [Clostridiales bacterium]